VPADTARLAALRTVEITTTGRRTGRPVRIEIWWFHFEDRFVITGTPGRRDWLANLRADPRLVVHALGQDIPARVRFVEDREYRRRFFDQSDPDVGWYVNEAGLTDLVQTAPMVEVLLNGPELP
jgi:deazaflavin-dependent oxidoreductase (nitroreductase family)